MHRAVDEIPERLGRSTKLSAAPYSLGRPRDHEFALSRAHRGQSDIDAASPWPCRPKNAWVRGNRVSLTLTESTKGSERGSGGPSVYVSSSAVMIHPSKQCDAKASLKRLIGTVAACR